MTKQKFPIPERIVRCSVMAVISLLLMFAMIFLGVYLTGGKEAENFTDIDKSIMTVLMAADAVLMIFYTIFIFAAARMFVIRRNLLDKRKERFGADGQSVVYHPCGDVWYDVHSGKRALSCVKGKLILVLIERQDSDERVWKPTAMRFYDSVQEMERALRNEYGIEWTDKPEASEEEDIPAIRVSIEDEESERISVSIEDGDL